MARIVEQIMIEVPDEVGKLAEVTETLKAAGVSILAECAWTMEGRGQMLLLTNDNAKACSALEGKVTSCDCDTSKAIAVTVADEIGALHEVARTLADAGIGISMCYATTTGSGEAMVVMSTDDNAKAASLV